MVTIKDVAREAGVAISTVSNVLNNIDVVSPETRKKVLDAVEALGYVPNMNAKLLKTNKRNTIGLFLSSVQGDFYRELIQSIHMQCRLKGYLLNIYISNENTSEEIYRIIISSGVEGAIVLNECLSKEHIDKLEQTNIPIVFLDRELKSSHMSSVIIDNVEGASMAVEYMIKLGHRRIGYFHGIYNYDDEKRYQGYLETMKKYSLEVDENYIFRGYFEEALAYSEMRIALLKGLPIPDAFFCANDEMAWGCIRALKEMGYRVPEDISVIGFDDQILAKFHNPPLTTIHSPVKEVGDYSVNEVIRMINKEGPEEGIVKKMMPNLVIRETCNVRL